MISQRRISLWLALLLAVAGVGIVWRGTHRIAELTREIASASARRAAWQRKVTALEMRLQGSDDGSGIAQNSSRSPGQDIVAGSTPREEIVTRTTTTMQVSDVDPRITAAMDPNLRALHLRAFAADLDGVWGPILKRLNLPPDKLQRFKALWLAHEERRLDVTAVAGEQTLTLNDAAIQKMRSADGARLAQEMRELLGPDFATVYQPYRRSLELQPIIAEVVAATYFTSSPLTLEQSERFREILSAHSEKRTNAFVSAGSIKWDLVLAEATASGAFSPSVIDALQRLNVERTAEAKAGEKLDELVRKHAAPGEAENLWLPGVSLRP